MLQLDNTYDAAILELETRYQGHGRLLTSLVKPTIVYTSSIGPYHLDTFGNLNGVLQGETEMYRWLQKHHVEPFTVVANTDDELLNQMYRNESFKQFFENIITISINKSSTDITAEDRKTFLSPDGLLTTFAVKSPWGNSYNAYR